MGTELDHLRVAAKLLADEKLPFRERFKRAADEFWAAMFDPAQWPAHLLPRANRIVDAILAEGPIRETLATMDDATARAIADEIARLACEVQQERPGEGLRSPRRRRAE